MISLVAVVGSGDADDALRAHARAVGRVIAEAGAGLLCGGRGGVMSAAAEGAHAALGAGSGRIIGILPGDDRTQANPWLDIALPTGLGHARNVLVAMGADAVVAVGGESGTLSEIAHAWHLGRPIAAYVPAGGWGARLAGTRLDDKRSDAIAAIATPGQLRRWLAAALHGLGNDSAAEATEAGDQAVSPSD